MKQKSVGLTLRAAILALALILVAGSPALPPFDGVAYAQSPTSTLSHTLLPSNNVQLGWTAVDGADGYRLWKGEGSGQSVSWGDSAHETFNAPTAYEDSAVTAGQTYSYVVEAMDGDTRLSWSNVLNITIPGGTVKPTGKPTVTLAADGLSAITVSWTTVIDAAHYQVRYWTGGLSGWEGIGGQESGTTYSHTGLTSGTQYFYIVRAVNDGGNGPWSGSPGNYASLTLEATTTVPVLTLDHPERLRVVLDWTRVSADAMYILQRQKQTFTDGKGDNPMAWANLVAAMSGTTYSDVTVMSDAADGDNNPANDWVLYSYRVQAEVDGVQGDWSMVRTATIPTSDALPPTPAGLAPTVISSSRINVAWSPAVGATSHQIQFKVGDGNYGSAMTVTAPYLHTGLNADTEYTYQVRSANVNGHSAWSAEESATTLAATATDERLATPTGLKAVDDTTAKGIPQIKVTWNASAEATSYELFKWTGLKWNELDLSTEDPSHTDKNVEAGTTYYYIVAALNAADDDMSDWSSPAMGMTDAKKPQEPPEKLTPTARSENRIWVSWSSVEEATEYILQWRTIGSSTWNSITVEGRTTHPHTGLNAGTKYQYKVAAKNSGGMSGYSDEEAETTWAGQLNTPTGLRAVDATTTDKDAVAQIGLTWTAVPGATGYELQKWSVGSSEWRNLAGVAGHTAVLGKTSHTDKGQDVKAGMTYYYIIRATNGDVRSSWSADVPGITKAVAPSSPTLHVDPTGQTMVRLTWTEVDSAVSYELQYVKGRASNSDLDNSNYQKTTLTLPAMPRHYTQLNLEQGTLYSYRIRGTLPLGVKSAWSNRDKDNPPETQQIITRPATPSLTASSISSTSNKLMWDIVNPPGFLDADALDETDYQLQRRTHTVANWTSVKIVEKCNGGKCEVTDKGLAPSTMYFYRLRVVTKPANPSYHDEIKSYWNTSRARTPIQ